LRKATEWVLGYFWVCGREPAPGSTGSAVGVAGLGGFGLAGLVATAVREVRVVVALGRLEGAAPADEFAVQPVSSATAVSAPTSGTLRFIMSPATFVRQLPER
jgi:hypothetical protein